ncbi:protein of unknown function [Taphrina deformans PYCC 5710]|uniref:Polynucleotide kinase 3'-phosphatase n=1 Tax=Taphrina deformans (strain PYCC 5710 / ATCC 11124 / CBS 356.35 / IMI 108563 / JCM 9778 / NBRC 8474) TaxID=1097556 RepID=R4XFU1_TAPDE|nr:protein of unknown function [Taphrina deformans PYCC 5710]|eukprot:CCG84736.1 protein of unknown function [Taphrina deformans PYCC 5710]
MLPESDASPPNKKARVSKTLPAEKPKSDLSWQIVQETLLTARYKSADIYSKLSPDLIDGESKIKLAAFDLDGTLIRTKSGTRFPRDETDWTFFDRSVSSKLRDLSNAGHLIVIFSNQAGLKFSDSAKRYSQWKLKLSAITAALDVPLLLYAASAHDNFRKPRLGMFVQCLKDLKSLSEAQSLSIQYDGSFFVGDAAGRPSNVTGEKRDFSASDRKFAINAQLEFHSPEEYFLSHPRKTFEFTGFDPVKFQNPERSDHLFLRLHTQEIVLFVGSPASGKSSYYKTFLQPLDYVRINQDTLKTRQKCIARARVELMEGKSVCVDNTNASVESRAHWLQLAADVKAPEKIPVRVVHFTADVELCEHNNAVRAFAPRNGEESRELLPAVAFSSFKGRYEPPRVEEGFMKLEQVEFILTGSPDEEQAWRQYWT